MPKAMLPVGGKPVIRWIIEGLKKHGLIDILICINSNFNGVFRDYLEDGSRFGVKIQYSVSDRPLGTAGEVFNARKRIGGSFLLYYGDELTPVNLSELIEFHRTRHDGLATLALVKNVPLEVGLVELDRDRVIEIKEKPPIEKTTWAGIALLEQRIFKYMKGEEDFASRVFPRALSSGEVIYGYVSDALWLDVGTLSHYKKADDLAKAGKLAINQRNEASTK